MDSLTRRDYRNALDFLAVLGEASDLDDFAARLTVGFGAVIRSVGASYNEYNRRRRRIRWIAYPRAGTEYVEAFEFHLATHPMIDHFARHPNSGAIRMSDLISQRQFHDLGVYRDVYRAERMERIMSDTIVDASSTIAVAVFRDGRDFSDRDRALMRLLRPHLINHYRNAEMLAILRHRVGLLEQGVDAAGLGAIELAPGNGTRSVSARARVWLIRYFPRPARGASLPAPVTEWLQRVSPQGTSHFLAASEPLRVRRGDDWLTLRLVRRGTERLVLMREQRGRIDPRELASLGLSPRRAEILAWVAAGKTDAEIAAILDISRRTVSHALEHIYRELNVETRVAAAARATRALGN